MRKAFARSRDQASMAFVGLSLSLTLSLVAVPSAPAIFDRSVEIVRPGFVGSDFMAVFNARQAKPKGEYETTEQYEKRIALIGGGDYAFRVTPQEIRYNADQGAFDVYMHTEPVYKGVILEAISHEDYALIVGTKDLPQGSYIGSNAMGAKVRVRKDTETQSAIVIPGDWVKVAAGRTFSVPVELALAPKVKAAMGFLYVCRLVSRGAEVARRVVVHIEPGIDHPLERTLVYHYLASEQVEVWTYNKATGKVLQKNVVDSHGYGEAREAVAIRGEAALAPPVPNSERTAHGITTEAPQTAAITAADAGPPAAVSVEPAGVAPAQSPGAQRVAVAGTSLSYPYTVEIPSGW